MRDFSVRVPELALSYRTGESDLLEDFYIPCLSAANAHSYDRAVGYFTSRSLRVFAQGLTEFVNRDGRIRLVTSPLLSSDDASAIEIGLRSRSLGEGDMKVIAEAVAREVRVASLEGRQSLELLAWLLAKGHLEMKLAVFEPGLYHEKFGIFHLGPEDTVVFTGSPNETQGGLVDNFESIDVFRNGYDDREDARVALYLQRFENLWNDRTPGVVIIDVPESLRSTIEAYTPERPPGERQAVTPRLHQEKAIRWLADRDFNGILALPTGTGKTFAALLALRGLIRAGKRLCIVEAPSVDLLGQWKANIQRVFPDARFEACSGETPWEARLPNFVLEWKLETKGPGLHYHPRFVLTTLHTGATERFITKFSNLSPDDFCIVFDEAHHAGAPKLRNALALRPRRGRIGLTATPTRSFDAEGTRILIDYFGDVYQTSLSEAIEQGILCRYEYYFHPVPLSSKEVHQYKQLSRDILRRIMAIAGDGMDANANIFMLLSRIDERAASSLELLYFKRADIIKSCEAKITGVKSLLAPAGTGRTIVYCNDEEQLELIRKVIRALGRRYLVFTSKRLRDEWERRRQLEEFKRNPETLLLTIDMANEGLDLPTCDTSIIISSSKTEREFIQRRGRVLRVSEGKPHAAIHDFLAIPSAVRDDGTWPPLEDDLERLIVRSELDRIGYFASDADNKVQLGNLLHELRKQLGLFTQ